MFLSGLTSVSANMAETAKQVHRPKRNEERKCTRIIVSHTNNIKKGHTKNTMQNKTFTKLEIITRRTNIYSIKAGGVKINGQVNSLYFGERVIFFVLMVYLRHISTLWRDFL